MELEWEYSTLCLWLCSINGEIVRLNSFLRTSSGTVNFNCGTISGARQFRHNSARGFTLPTPRVALQLPTSFSFLQHRIRVPMRPRTPSFLQHHHSFPSEKHNFVSKSCWKDPYSILKGNFGKPKYYGEYRKTWKAYFEARIFKPVLQVVYCY